MTPLTWLAVLLASAAVAWLALGALGLCRAAARPRPQPTWDEHCDLALTVVDAGRAAALRRGLTPDEGDVIVAMDAGWQR